MTRSEWLRMQLDRALEDATLALTIATSGRHERPWPSSGIPAGQHYADTVVPLRWGLAAHLGRLLLEG